MIEDTEQTNPLDAAVQADTGTEAGHPDHNGVADVTQDAECTSQLIAQQEKYLRLAAEYDNYRKRTAKEARQASLRGQAELIRVLLNSLDDLTRLAHIDATAIDATAIVQGVEMIEKNMLKAFTEVGVDVIDPVELPFDPNVHEAVSTQAAESPDEDHMVAQVYQRGYTLKGQLLRPARVVVKQYQ